MPREGKELSVEAKENIISLIENGLRQAEVARLLNVHRSTIGRVVQRFRQSKTVENKKRTGRPPCLTQRNLHALSRIVKRKRIATVPEITEEFRLSTSVEASEITIKRVLRRLGYRKCVAVKQMVVREVNKKKRLDYCRGKLLWKVTPHWRKVIFSDEMSIVVSPNGRVKLWRKAEEKWSVHCVEAAHLGPRSTLKLMVWGCISYQKVGPLVFVEGTMNSAKYTNVLADHFLPFVAENFAQARWYLQDDNASIHRSANTDEWKRQHGIPGFFWPPQSPDLNPIENVWKVMKIHVKKNIAQIRTVGELQCALAACWNGLSATYLRSLYASLPRRCRQVLTMKGNITKY